MAAKPIPAGHPTVVPHLTINDGQGKQAVTFYQKALGAEVVSATEMPDGRILHAELKLGSARIFLNDGFGPPSGPPAGVTLNIWTEDANALWARATGAGAEVTFPIMDAFWGDRYGVVADPFGHSWGIAQRLEEVTSDEMQRRALEWFASMKEGGGG